MLIVINPYAACGNAMKKWNSFEHYIKNKGQNIDITLTNNSKCINEMIQESIRNGETEFVAAGGDGTINYLLNSILAYPDQNTLKLVKIGAVGLGSSNDFHKPFKNVLNGIPYKINFEDTKHRDIGILKYTSEDKIVVKYFLINASIGLTALGNYNFNHPNKTLANLKRYQTSSAIYYAALQSILAYKNINAKIISCNGSTYESKISNLGIVKNPNFSGNLSYNSMIEYDNGLFNIHLAENLNKLKTISLLRKLRNRRALNELIKTWTADEIVISSDQEFCVEFDGETITASSVEFGILQKKIMVCGS